MQHSSLSLSLPTIMLAGLLLNGSVLAAPKFAEGRILVKPAAGLSEEQFDRVLKNAHAQAKSKRKLRKLPVHVIEVPIQAEQGLVRALSRHPQIAFAELDELIAQIENYQETIPCLVLAQINEHIFMSAVQRTIAPAMQRRFRALRAWCPAGPARRSWQRPRNARPGSCRSGGLRSH